MSPKAGMTARRTSSRRRMRRLEKEKRPMPYPVTGFSLCVNDPVGRRLGQEEEVYLRQVSALTGFLSLLKGCKINAIRSPPALQSIERSGGGGWGRCGVSGALCRRFKSSHRHQE